MTDLNIRFSNCFDFINNMKEVIESNPDRWDNIYMEKSIFHAEIDLMEMELEASYDAEEYDSLMNRNIFRSSKRVQRRKQNKKNKSRDRIHGRRHGGAHGGIDFRYIDCNPFCNKHRYEDAMFVTNGKHRFNSVKKASAMDAKEQEYYSSYPVEEEAKEAEVTEITEEEAGTFDDFLWYLVDTLSESKYIMLYSFDNGQSYEDHDGCAYEFRGVMTKDKIITELTENLLRHDCEVEVNKTEVEGLKGIDFNWDFGTNEDWGDWNGYESFSIIPVSELN